MTFEFGALVRTRSGVGRLLACLRRGNAVIVQVCGAGGGGGKYSRLVEILKKNS